VSIFTCNGVNVFTWNGVCVTFPYKCVRIYMEW